MGEDVARKFWQLISDGRFDEAGSWMKPDASVWLPNTRELFRGRDKYIAFNKKYPGRWRLEIEKIITQDSTTVAAIRVEAAEGTGSFYLTAFMSFRDNLIFEMTEYWGDNTDPPAWRLEQQLSERY